MHTKVLILALVARATAAQSFEPGLDVRGHQFVGLTSFNDFAETAGSNPGEKVLSSPVIMARTNFNEVIISWNVEMPENSYLIVEARAFYAQTTTRYYKLGLWSPNPTRHPRQSVAHQNDADAEVSTDILILHHAADRFQIRLTLGGDGAPLPVVKFLGLSLTDTTSSPSELPPNRDVWGKPIAVPERSQMAYPNGKTLCSPTTVSMLMAYWAQTLGRPELDRPVPAIADSIYDSQWQGTGNWPFNMAYAGSFHGLRAYVTRLSDVSELEAWIARDIPVGMSVDYDRLRAKGPGPNGHIVALVGFTKTGDPIINDPGTTKHVRKVFPRAKLIEAWACSRNTVYLIYPENHTTPEDRFGHWYSPSSAQMNRSAN